MQVMKFLINPLKMLHILTCVIEYAKEAKTPSVSLHACISSASLYLKLMLRDQVQYSLRKRLFSDLWHYVSKSSARREKQIQQNRGMTQSGGVCKNSAK